MQNLSISKLKKQKADGLLSDDFLNSYCMMVYSMHQYAEGITGINYTCSVYIKSDNMGYAYAGEGYKALKDKGIKKINIKGEPTPYGNIGQKYSNREAIKISDFLDAYKSLSYMGTPYIVTKMTQLTQ